MIDFKLRIRKIILETLLYEEEFRLDQERNEAKQALFAFMEEKVKVGRIEDSKEEELSDAISKNDFTHQGSTYMTEEPIILITFNNKDFSISATIQKEYFYKTEDASMDFPGHQEIYLKNIEIISPHVLVYNEFGTEFLFTPTEIGSQNMKHLEKIFKKYIK